MLNAKAIAQAAVLDEAAKALKRAGYANREALHAVRQVQAELNELHIEVETITPTAHRGAEDDNQSEAQAA